MSLVKVKTRETFKHGELLVHIDDYSRSVRVERPGGAVHPQELRQVHKLLAYHRPREFSEHVFTGWEVETVIQL